MNVWATLQRRCHSLLYGKSDTGEGGRQYATARTASYDTNRAQRTAHSAQREPLSISPSGSASSTAGWLRPSFQSSAVQATHRSRNRSASSECPLACTQPAPCHLRIHGRNLPTYLPTYLPTSWYSTRRRNTARVCRTDTQIQNLIPIQFTAIQPYSTVLKVDT
jgi:hypothetical protein